MSPAMRKPVEVEGQGVGCEIERGRDGAGRQSIRPGFHQQAKHIETVFLRKRGEGGDGKALFHISTNIEIYLCRQWIWFWNMMI